MSLFGKNIRKIRTVKKLSQTGFADLFQLTRASIGAYEEGRAEAKTDTIISIAKYFRISIDALLTKELTVNEIIHFDLFKEEYQNNQIAKKRNEDFIPLVSISDIQEYIMNIEKADYIEKLETIKMPHSKDGIYRAFEHWGNEMTFNTTGLHHGDIVIGKLVQNYSPNHIRNKELYVFVTQQNIKIRRLEAKQDFFTLNADNPRYKSNQINKEQLKELWEIQSYQSVVLQKPTTYDERLSRLEFKVEQLLESNK